MLYGLREEQAKDEYTMAQTDDSTVMALTIGLFCEQRYYQGKSPWSSAWR
jgi:hypothetical protein